MASACCLAGLRLARLGQSMLATVETQAARNSRGAGGGVSPFGPPATPACRSACGRVEVHAENRPPAASAPATPASAKARLCLFTSTTAPSPYTLMNMRRRHNSHATANMHASNSSACSSDVFTDPIGSAASGAYSVAPRLRTPPSGRANLT